MCLKALLLLWTFQHTAARRRLAANNAPLMPIAGFNTQPPEGGWLLENYAQIGLKEFQHTAARRRLVFMKNPISSAMKFQHTAARRRLVVRNGVCYYEASFQHTAARRRLVDVRHAPKRGKHRFNTQPPEGGWILRHQYDKYPPCFNTQPPEGGWARIVAKYSQRQRFQHTAARRRLGRPTMRP